MGDLDQAKFSVKWQSPSNIAIVKYWGKKDTQIPINPSVSFSLKHSLTTTEIVFKPKSQNSGISFDFCFDGSQNKVFEDKIRKYFNHIHSQFTIFDRYHLSISSSNTFPHSAGIASSASAMSALVLCLLSIEYPTGSISTHEFYQKASYYARLASGSACRSVYPGFSLWGENEAIKNTSDDYAIQLTEIHPHFNQLQDAILIVGSKQKKVSSSKGHQLMEQHPFRKARIEQANAHTKDLIRALSTGDFQSFARISELEAMSLHALMMTSDPSYVLMEANSLTIIEKIKQFRQEHGVDLCFTLDAGPNIHLIYPLKVKEIIVNFIKKELLVHCESDRWMDDEMGFGPKQLND